MPDKTLAIIRTHRWDEDTARICAQLQPVFGDDLVIAFHNRPADVVPPVRVADLNDGWLREQGLRVLNDWGWRCGDYFHYCARAAFPDYTHYWMLEPDVFFTGQPQDFFAAAAALPHDVLGVQMAPINLAHRFGRAMPDMPLYRAIFALTRFSARATDQLLALRRSYSAGKVGARLFANDEVFCFSHAMAQPDLTCGSMCDLLPAWIDPVSLATDPDVLLELLAPRTTPGVFHPVRGRASFLRAVAARIAQNTHFLAKMAPSLGRLTDAELVAIASDVGARCLESLHHARTSGPEA